MIPSEHTIFGTNLFFQNRCYTCTVINIIYLYSFSYFGKSSNATL